MKYLAYCLVKGCMWEFPASSYEDTRDQALHHSVAKPEHRARVLRLEQLPFPAPAEGSPGPKGSKKEG